MQAASYAIERFARWDDNKNFLARAGAVAPLIEIVRDGRRLAQELAASALATLTASEFIHGSENKSRMMIGQLQGVGPLISLARNGNEDARVHAAKTLANLGVMAEDFETVESLLATMTDTQNVLEKRAKQNEVGRAFMIKLRSRQQRKAALAAAAAAAEEDSIGRNAAFTSLPQALVQSLMPGPRRRISIFQAAPAPLVDTAARGVDPDAQRGSNEVMAQLPQQIPAGLIESTTSAAMSDKLIISRNPNRRRASM